MSIEIIPLAKMKMERRGIEKEMIIETLKEPDNIIEGHSGRKIAQRLYTDLNNKKLLRVVYEEENETKLVITCYLTSQIERYKEEGKDESDV